MVVPEGMGEERVRPVLGEEESISRAISAEKKPEMVDEVHIPDYVMHDFGLSDKRHPGT
jgi:hypothetical protein